MCTAIAYGRYFGRNLDLDHAYHETVTVTPRNYPFHFRRAGKMDSHYAMIGMAHVADGYPLYYDAVNEKGLAAAGLYFPLSAVYRPEQPGRDNISPFELIPWLLGRCGSLREARELLCRLNPVNLPFNSRLPLFPLHWMIAGPDGAIAVEPAEEGIKVYDDPAGVLTNEPPFPCQMFHLASHMQLTREQPRGSFADGLGLKPYCLGLGAMGLPGDLSSASRFVRAAFTRFHAVPGQSEKEAVSQFFHILGSVAQTKGCVRTENGFEATVYSCCCNRETGVYYYTTYENSRITAVDMRREDLDGKLPVCYPLIREQQVKYQN